MPAPLIAEILHLHADEAAFLWTVRDAAAVAAHYDRASLMVLDERLDAQIDGLRIGGAEAFSIVLAGLDPEEPGTAFAAAVLAIERGDAERMEALVAMAEAAPTLARTIVSALAWVPFETARAAIEPLVAPSAPAATRRIGIAASAAHRKDPGEALAYAILDDDRSLKARALRAAGELGRRDLLDPVRAALQSDDPEHRYWAAWSAALLGAEGAAIGLWSLADEGGRFAEPACAMAVRRLAPREAWDRLEKLSAVTASARTVMAGALALGEPAMVPWLLGCMETPTLARPAGEAFSAITGVAIEGAFQGSMPEGFDAGPSDRPEDESVAVDRDWPLQWPARDALAAWWAARGSSFRRGVRYIRGVPLAPAIIESELHSGTQRRRAAAAIELALQRPGQPLIETRSRR